MPDDVTAPLVVIEVVPVPSLIPATPWSPPETAEVVIVRLVPEVDA